MARGLILMMMILGMCNEALAQNIPVGTWQSMLPYNSASAVVQANGIIYSGKYGLLAYDKVNNSYTQYTTVNGLSSSDIIHLGYNKSSDALVICYSNVDIDIFSGGAFTNIPDVRIANIAGSKGINSLAQYGGRCIIGSDLGIIYLNVQQKEIEASFPIVISGVQALVKQVLIHHDSLYAVTSLGVMRIAASEAFPQEMSRWQVLTTAQYDGIALTTDSSFAYKTNNVYSTGNWQYQNLVYTAPKRITDFLLDGDTAYVTSFTTSTGATIALVTKAGTWVEDITGTGTTKLIADEQEQRLWCADAYNGLREIKKDRSTYLFGINGPRGNLAFKLRHIDGRLFATCGDVDGAVNPKGNSDGLNIYENNTWKNYSVHSGYAAMDTAYDILDIAYDIKTKKIYAPSYNLGGLLEISEQDQIKVYKYGTGLDPALSGEPTRFSCSHVVLDKKNTLWLTMAFVNNNLTALTNTGTWHKFKLPNAGGSNVIGEVLIDNANQKWVVLPRGQGLAVYNDNNTIDNPTDDKSRLYTEGVGSGNLASSTVLTATLDGNGKVWVGTSNGISIINCPENATESSGCDAENKTVKYDIKPDKLFIGETVRAIAVDGGNRKWVGTDNGLWLISDDAEKIILQFNESNSPLPSNEITSIAIDPASGMVYIGTRNGIVAYRSDATNGVADEAIEPLVFPNPVRADWPNGITISNLLSNGEVMIVDAAGQLVYKTRANGGTASWNGLTYAGAKPQSGVYIILVTNSDGSLKQKASFTFIH
jgi:hypothetical protein